MARLNPETSYLLVIMHATRPLFSTLLPVLLGLSLAGASPAAEPTEAALLAVLSSEAGVHEKARACQQLAVVATPAAVPALASLLDQDPLADYARSGLEAIADPAAGEALRMAMGRLNGRLLAGVVNSLGVRRDTAAVPGLQKLVLDGQSGVAAESLASLGMIGTVEAAKILDTALTSGADGLRVPAAHAALAAATQLAKAGNPAAARALLGDVVRAKLPGHLTAAAQRQLAALPAN
jgi:HEAT repeat protein